ncbi:hypothetical protein [Pseudomonas proteolytica]|uniref:hypothetical protein n=1 Tax=Pseudomonas proteolytica TaxID=219574 RepID=UPI003207E64A
MKEFRWVAFTSLGEKFILPDSLWLLLEQQLLLLPVRPELILIESKLYDQLSDSGRLNAETLNIFLKQTVREHYVDPPCNA